MTIEDKLAEIRREADREYAEIEWAKRFFGWAYLFVGLVWTPAIAAAWAMGWL